MMLRFFCLLLLLLAAEGRAEEAGSTLEGSDGAPSESVKPKLSLDRLLRVPPPSVESSPLRGGKDRERWQQEFATVRAEITELEVDIRKAQEELRASSGDDWQFSPTGGGPTQDPEVLKLSSSLRRDRQSLQAARQRLRELEVEASLAEVPDPWRHPEEGE